MQYVCWWNHPTVLQRAVHVHRDHQWEYSCLEVLCQNAWLVSWSRASLLWASLLILVHNNFACEAMQLEVHVNAYWQCKNRKKFLFLWCNAKCNQIILYRLPVASRCKLKCCEPVLRGTFTAGNARGIVSISLISLTSFCPMCTTFPITKTHSNIHV